MVNAAPASEIVAAAIGALVMHSAEQKHNQQQLIRGGNHSTQRVKMFPGRGGRRDKCHSTICPRNGNQQASARRRLDTGPTSQTLTRHWAGVWQLLGRGTDLSPKSCDRFHLSPYFWREAAAFISTPTSYVRRCFHVALNTTKVCGCLSLTHGK